jgi:hypothetical protein
MVITDHICAIISTTYTSWPSSDGEISDVLDLIYCTEGGRRPMMSMSDANLNYWDVYQIGKLIRQFQGNGLPPETARFTS